MSVSLAKGERVSLAKKGGGGLTSVTMGLGWSPAQKAKKGGFLGGLLGGGGGADSIDLDASCLAFAGRGVVAKVWFRDLQGLGGAIQHSGDNRTGEGDGDDETIRIDLARLPPEVDRIALTVNSFTGQTFDEVEDAFCRVVDNATGSEVARFDLREKGRHTGVVMAILAKDGSGIWSMEAVGKAARGQTVDQMSQDVLACF